MTGGDKANAALQRAIRAGLVPPITATTACADCGKPATEYDHRDYNKPLDVDPVCHRCNIRRGPAVFLKDPANDIFSDDEAPQEVVKRTSQARRIFQKFGNARRLAQAIGCQPSTVYRWDYPKDKGGTGGLIPSSALPEVLEAARQAGIFITSDDLYPGRR
jgi:hypothetical protein